MDKRSVAMPTDSATKMDELQSRSLHCAADGLESCLSVTLPFLQACIGTWVSVDVCRECSLSGVGM